MAAILWADEDFDKNIFVEINNAAIPVAQNMGSWCGQAIAGAGSSNVSWLQVDNVLGHLGILRIPTGTTSGNSSMLFLARDSQAGGPSPSEALVPIQHFRRMEAWVRVPTITTVQASVGLGQNLNNNSFGTAGFFFDYNAAISANWRAVTREASVNTVVDTGVAVVAGAWYKLTLTKAGDVWRYSTNVSHSMSQIDAMLDNDNYSGLVRLPNSNLPSVDLVLGARVATATSGARNFDIDRIRVWLDEEAMVT